MPPAPDEPQPQEPARTETPPQKRSLWPAIIGVLILAAVIAAIVIFGQPLLPLFSDPATARETIGGLGAAAPLAFIAMQIAQVVIAPLPGQVSGLIGGFLFGPWLGLLYTMIGAFLGF